MEITKVNGKNVTIEMSIQDFITLKDCIESPDNDGACDECLYQGSNNCAYSQFLELEPKGIDNLLEFYKFFNDNSCNRCNCCNNCSNTATKVAASETKKDIPLGMGIMGMGVIDDNDTTHNIDYITAIEEITKNIINELLSK